MAEEFIFDLDSVWVVAKSVGVTGDEGARVLADPDQTLWMDTEEKGRAVVLFTDSASAEDFARSMGRDDSEAVTFASRHEFSEFLKRKADSGIRGVVIDPVPGKKAVRLYFDIDEVRSSVQQTIDNP
jgi:hypothetical protein